jgi:hypothetical protein
MKHDDDIKQPQFDEIQFRQKQWEIYKNWRASRAADPHKIWVEYQNGNEKLSNRIPAGDIKQSSPSFKKRLEKRKNANQKENRNGN